MRLDQVAYERVNRVKTSISELDRVLGGGVVPGSPQSVEAQGLGNLPLLLPKSLVNYNKHKGPFSSGEESASQIKCVQSV